MSTIVKNRIITVDRRRYEIFYSTAIAQKIHRRLSEDKSGKVYLNFDQIEDVITRGIVFLMGGVDNDRYLFVLTIDGKEYCVVAYLRHGRCIIKSGRINNYNQYRGYGKESEPVKFSE